MSFLHDLRLLENLSDSEKEELSMFCQEKKLMQWETLFDEWDEGNALYILKSGAVSISKFIDGSSVELWVVNAEEVLWEMSLFWDHSTRMGKAVAVEDTVLVTILNFSIKEMTSRHPELLDKIQSIIEERKIDNQIKEHEIRDI